MQGLFISLLNLFIYPCYANVHIHFSFHGILYVVQWGRTDDHELGYMKDLLLVLHREFLNLAERMILVITHAPPRYLEEEESRNWIAQELQNRKSYICQFKRLLKCDNNRILFVENKNPKEMISRGEFS